MLRTDRNEPTRYRQMDEYRDGGERRIKHAGKKERRGQATRAMLARQAEQLIDDDQDVYEDETE